MAVNAGFEYINAEKKYHEATTPQAKLEALNEMLRAAPSHKASENFRREITRKIAKLKMEIEKEKASGGKKGGGTSLNVKKDGEAQIAIIGLPNSGKSTLLSRITGVDTPIAPYPFTTTTPVIGMLNYKGALIQLVEMPALIEGSSEGKANGTQVLSAIRNSDALIILFQQEEDKKIIIHELEKTDILLNRSKPNIIIKPGEAKGISLGGTHLLKVPQDKAIEALRSGGIQNASVLFQEPTTIEMIQEVLNQRISYKKAMFLNAFEDFSEEELKKSIFELTGKIIVYTKKPGQQPDLNDPLVIDKGTTVEDCATKLHKDMAKNLKNVRVWGSAKFSGQHVSKDYELQNDDVIEISSN